MSIALIKIIAAVIVTKSIPSENFSLSFATSNENSPIDIIAMLEKNGCSSLKLASRNVKNPMAMNREIIITNINTDIRTISDSIALKFISVPMDMKKIDVKINAYGWIAFPYSFALGIEAIKLPAKKAPAEGVNPSDEAK